MSADRRRKRVALGELTPGQHLRAEIEKLGLDQVSVSQATGVSRQSINNIVNDRQPISRAMAGKLGRLTGHGSDYWLRASFTVAAAGSRQRSGESDPAVCSGLLVNRQIAQAVRTGVVVITPFDAANVQPASVTLTLGADLTAPDGKTIYLERGQSFTLRRNQTINVRTKERIELPHDHVGRVGALASLATRGIVTSAGFQIAPGFSGCLELSLFNSGQKGFTLQTGMPVISLEIIVLDTLPTIDDAAFNRPRRR